MYTYLRGFASGAGMKGSIAKFSQNEPLKEFLLETGGACWQRPVHTTGFGASGLLRTIRWPWTRKNGRAKIFWDLP